MIDEILVYPKPPQKKILPLLCLNTFQVHKWCICWRRKRNKKDKQKKRERRKGTEEKRARIREKTWNDKRNKSLRVWYKGVVHHEGAVQLKGMVQLKRVVHHEGVDLHQQEDVDKCATGIEMTRIVIQYSNDTHVDVQSTLRCGCGLLVIYVSHGVMLSIPKLYEDIESQSFICDNYN